MGNLQTCSPCQECQNHSRQASDNLYISRPLKSTYDMEKIDSGKRKSEIGGGGQKELLRPSTCASSINGVSGTTSSGIFSIIPKFSLKKDASKQKDEKKQQLQQKWTQYRDTSNRFFEDSSDEEGTCSKSEGQKSCRSEDLSVVLEREAMKETSKLESLNVSKIDTCQENALTEPKVTENDQKTIQNK